MYQKIKDKISENYELIMAASIVVLTITVIRSRPRFVRDVLISEGAKEIFVEFSDGTANTYSLTK